MAVLSERWSLIGRGSYTKKPSFGNDRVPSQDHNPSTHTYTTPTTRERTRISPGLIPPRAAWK